MLLTVADEFVIAGVAADLSFQAIDQYGDPAGPAGPVTVTVVRSDGTAVVTDAATSGAGSSARQVSLAATDIPTVDRLTATWSSSGSTVGTTIVDVVGGPLLSKADFDVREPNRAGTSAVAFRQALREVDDFIRERCNRSFVPRLEVERFYLTNPTRSISLRFPALQSVVWAVDENGTAIPGATTARPNEAGIATLDDYWWDACEHITVAYIHGYTRPPDDIKGAVAKLVAARLVEGSSGVPVRATAVSTPLGSASFTPLAGYGRALTAIPEVDEALNRHTFTQALVR